MMISRWPLLASLSMALAVAACAGGTEDDDGADSGPKDSGSLPCLEANFSSIYARFNSTQCATAGCHDSGTAGGGQDYSMSKDDVHATLLGDTVNVMGKQMQAKRVVPGDPDASFLWIKVSRDDAPLGRMPLAATPLQQCDLDAINAWITNGAMND